MNFYRPVLFTSFVILLVVVRSEALPERSFRSNRRLANQQVEPDAAENEVTSTQQPSVYSNNGFGYGGFGGFGNGFQSGFSFLPPPLVMMMMMRNGALVRAFLGPDGIDMNTVQRILQAIIKVLQEIEQEKQVRGNVGNAQSASQLKY